MPTSTERSTEWTSTDSAPDSPFGTCEIKTDGIGLEVRLKKETEK